MITDLANARAALVACLKAAQPHPVHAAPFTDAPPKCIVIGDPSMYFQGQMFGEVTWNIQLRGDRVPALQVSNDFDAWLMPVLEALSKGAGCGFNLVSAAPETGPEYQVPAYGIVGTTTVTLC